jgi:hypothetical protein
VAQERGQQVNRDRSLSWQDQLDRWFPDGAFCVLVRDVPEEEDAPSWVCPRLVVEDQGAEGPTLRIVVPGLKTTITRLRWIEDYATTPDRFDVLVHTDAATYRMTTYLTDESRVYARRERMEHPEMYGLEP